MPANDMGTLEEMKRIVKLRAQQLEAAALCRDAGEIKSEDWDGYAARYAAAVREYRIMQQVKINEQPSMAETRHGGTWVQA